MSRSRVRVTFPAPKKTVFGLSFFIHCESNGISSPQAYIINNGIAVVVSHHAIGVYENFRNDNMQNVALVIYNFCEIDDIHGYAVIYFDTKKLNARIPNELIEKIVASEKEIIDGEKYQCVHIYYKFVGVMSV